MKKNVIHKHRQQLENRENFLDPYREPIRAILGDVYLLRTTTQKIARASLPVLPLRDKLFRENDIEGVFEYIAAAGEKALLEPWIYESIHWWREILDRHVHYQWPPTEFASDKPKKIVCTEQEDGSLVLRDPNYRARRAPKGRLSRYFRVMPSYYRWRPIPLGEYRKFQAAAKRNLKHIGKALAFIGGGRGKKLTAKEAKEKKKASDRTQINDKRAGEYLEKAWQRYEAMKANLIQRKRIDKYLLDTVVEHITKEEFSRGGEAKRMAQQWFTDKVNCDVATLLSNRILR